MLLTFQSHIYKNKSQTHLTCINTHSHGSIYSYTFVSAAGNTSGNITELTGVFTESTHTNMPGYCTVRPNPALYLARVPSFKAKKSGKTQKKRTTKIQRQIIWHQHGLSRGPGTTVRGPVTFAPQPKITLTHFPTLFPKHPALPNKRNTKKKITCYT